MSASAWPASWPVRATTRPISPTSRRRATWSPPCCKHHGRLDVLVNNAGESIRIPHADLKAATPAVWRRMLDVNLIAPFVLIDRGRAGAAQVGRGRPAGLHRQYRHPCRRAAQGRLDSLCDGQGGPASRHAPAGPGAGAGHPRQLRGAGPGRDADGRQLARGDRALEHPLGRCAGLRNPRTSPIWWPRWSPTTTLPERSSSPMVG